MINTYIFDLDETIVDKTVYARMYNELINELLSNLNITEIELQEVITKLKKDTGKNRPDTFELCKKLQSTELYYKVLEKYARHTYKLKTRSIPLLFRKIYAANKKIGVVSNSQKRTIEIFLNRFNLMEYTNFILSGDKSTVLFWMTLEKKFKIIREETMVIDDNDEVLDVAKHVGFKVLNVKNIEDLEGFKI